MSCTETGRCRTPFSCSWPATSGTSSTGSADRPPGETPSGADPAPVRSDGNPERRGLASSGGRLGPCPLLPRTALAWPLLEALQRMIAPRGHDSGQNGDEDADPQ